MMKSKFKKSIVSEALHKTYLGSCVSAQRKFGGAPTNSKKTDIQTDPYQATHVPKLFITYHRFKFITVEKLDTLQFENRILLLMISPTFKFMPK